MEKNGSYHLLVLRLSQQNITQLFLVNRWEMLNVRGIRAESSLTFISKAQKYEISCCASQDPLKRALPWNVWTNLSGDVGGKCITPGVRMWQNVTLCVPVTFLTMVIIHCVLYIFIQLCSDSFFLWLAILITFTLLNRLIRLIFMQLLHTCKSLQKLVVRGQKLFVCFFHKFLHTGFRNTREFFILSEP